MAKPVMQTIQKKKSLYKQKDCNANVLRKSICFKEYKSILKYIIWILFEFPLSQLNIINIIFSYE